MDQQQPRAVLIEIRVLAGRAPGTAYEQTPPADLQIGAITAQPRFGAEGCRLCGSVVHVANNATGR